MSKQFLFCGDIDISSIRKYQFNGVLSLLIISLCGCGSGSQDSTLTKGLLLLSSTANGQLLSYTLTISDISLTNQTGKTVHLLSAPQTIEAVHANGIADPITLVGIPRDTYISATMTYVGGSFSLETSSPSLTTNAYSSLFTSGSSATVSLAIPTPLVVRGSAEILSLTSSVEQSFSLAGPNGFTLSPTFTLSTSSIPSSPVTPATGYETDIFGEVASLSGSNSFVLRTTQGALLTIDADDSTLYQGIVNLGELLPGQPLDCDFVTQTDGSLLARRVEANANVGDLIIGPAVPLIASVAGVGVYLRQQEGPDFSNLLPLTVAIDVQTIPQTIYKIEGSYHPPASLPFTPVFGSSNFSFGQVVAAFGSFNSQTGKFVNPAIVLVPQTIYGTVTAVSGSNNSSKFVLTLEKSDFLAMLNGINQISVYGTSEYPDVQVGQQVRAYGFLFQDQGDLRMVASSVIVGSAI